MKRIFLNFIFLFVISCSSGPEPKKVNAAPTWTQQPTRMMDGANHLVYVGIGEDRKQQNARTKAEAIALQDLANDCSLIPKGTQILPEHYEDMGGIIYRSFAMIRVDVQACLATKDALRVAQVRDLANPELTSQVNNYQKIYDAPEPEESAPLKAPTVISDSAHLFIVRQQVALAKQKMLLSPGDTPSPQGLSNAIRAIDAFEKANPTVWNGSRAFSTARPNAIDHQASAVRDTIEDRTGIRKEYPAMPLPATQSKSSNSTRGGKGSHRRGQQQQTPPQTPTPVQSNTP